MQSCQPTDYALVLGEAIMDLIVREHEQPKGQAEEQAEEQAKEQAKAQAIPGGSPANVALGLARLDRPTLLHTCLGNDNYGQAITTHLEHSGVHLSSTSRTTLPTSTARATIGADHAASYDFDVHWEPQPLELTHPPALIHTGSIAAVTEPGAGLVHDIIATYQGESVICYDPNVRPQLMGTPAATRPKVETLVSLSDLVKCSDEDASWLYPDLSQDQLAQHWLNLGASLVVMTLGGKGSKAWTQNAQVSLPATHDIHVVDTVGAGDSFMAGLEDGLFKTQISDLDTATVEQLLVHATKIAGITVSRAGANPPYRAEL